MGGFTKLVPEIVQSSIWNESSDTRIVWLTMLAIKDETGYVRGTAETLARIANVPLELTKEALVKFTEPDPSSHTPDHEGRRITDAPGGWLVLNSDLYRGQDERERHREYMREYMRKYRKISNSGVKDVKLTGGLHSASASVSVPSREEGVGEGKEGQAPWPRESFDFAAKSLSIPDSERDKCWGYYDSQGWKKKNGHRVQGDPRSILTSLGSKGLRGMEVSDEPPPGRATAKKSVPKVDLVFDGSGEAK